MIKKFLTTLLSVAIIIAGSVFPAKATVENEVTALSKDGVVFRMGLIGDVHISDTGAFTDYMEQAVKTLNTVGGIDVYGFTGDMISYDKAVTEAPYDYLNKILADGNISNTTEGATPYIYAMGNHEYIHNDANKETCTQAMEMFETKMGHSVDYHKEYKSYHVIAGGAHSYQFQWSDGEFNANEEWMMSEIEAIEAEEDYNPDEPIFLIMHLPIENSVLRGITNIGNKYSTEFKEFLKKRPNIVQISGHYHMAAQYPQTICQDLGYTAFQAPVTSSVGVQDKHQVSFIDVTEDNIVKIYKIDIMTGKYIGEPWVIDIAAGVDGFKYTDKIRGNNTQAPVFSDSDKITFSNVYYYSTTVDFPIGKIEAKNGQQDNMVRSHRLTVTNKNTGEVINQISYDADFWVIPQPERLTRTITGLEIGTPYTISIEPRSMFGFYGEPLTAEFTTKGNPYEETVSEPTVLDFNPELVGEVTDANGTTSYDTLNQSDIMLRQGNYFTYTLNVGEGEQIEEAGLYKLIYNYSSTRETTVQTYVKWQDNEKYVQAEKSVSLPASGDYDLYTTYSGEEFVQLRDGTNVIKIEVSKLSDDDVIHMRIPTFSKLTSASYIDCPLNISVYNPITGENGTGTGSITSGICTKTYQTDSMLSVRKGDYIVVPLMVPCTSTYELDLEVKVGREIKGNVFKAAYSTESPEAAGALTTYTNSTESLTLKTSWQMLNMGDTVVLEEGKVYYFKITPTAVGRGDVVNISNIRFTDTGEYHTNANLASLTVSEGAFDKKFNAETTEYTVYSNMPESGKITVDATVEIDGATVSGLGEVSVNYGINEKVPVMVTSKNGKARKTYYITFVIAQNHASLGCENAVMYVDGSTSGKDVSKLFDGTGVVKVNGSSGAGFGVGYSSTAYIDVDLGAEYDLHSFSWERTNAGNSVTGITIWGSNDPNFATYEILGTTYDSIEDGKSASSFTHKVMTTTLNATETYRYVRINKPKGSKKDFYPVKMDLYGTALIDCGITGNNITVNVPSNHYMVGDTVIVALYDENDVVTSVKTVKAENTEKAEFVVEKKNGDASFKVMVWKGLDSLIPQTEAYYFNGYDTNANLASLTVSEGTFNKAFDADITEYTVYADIPENGKITLDASVEVNGAVISGLGEVIVNYGVNEKVPVTVTSKNGEVTKTYYITFVIGLNTVSLGCTDAVMYVDNSTDGIDISKLFNGTGVVKVNGSSSAGFGVSYSSSAYIDVDLGEEYELYSFAWERTNAGNSVEGITIWGSDEPTFATYEVLGTTYDTIEDGKSASSFTHKVMTTMLTASKPYRYVRINKPSGSKKDFYPVKMDLYGFNVN